LEIINKILNELQIQHVSEVIKEYFVGARDLIPDRGDNSWFSEEQRKPFIAE
jgi:hypothetical protein